MDLMSGNFFCYVCRCLPLNESGHTPVSFTGCTFLNNHADMRGGAVYIQANTGFYSAVTFTDCQVLGWVPKKYEDVRTPKCGMKPKKYQVRRCCGVKLKIYKYIIDICIIKVHTFRAYLCADRQIE